MIYEPKPGHYLHASCSDTDVYEILGSGHDANGAPTIDVRVVDVNELLHFEHNNDDDGGWNCPLTVAELPAGVHLVLRDMQWRPAGGGETAMILVNAPEGGCYRCCYLFSVHASPGGCDPIGWEHES